MERRQRKQFIWTGAALLLAIALAVVAFIQQGTIFQLREERQTWQDNLKELEQLRAATNRSGANLDRQADSDQRVADSKEVLRLRSEMTRLREQARQVDALQAANAKLLQALQANGVASSNQDAVVASVRKQGAILGVAFMPAENTPPTQRYRGVLVNSIMPDAPAAHSGLRPGDIIFKVDGHPIENPTQLESEMLSKRPGATVTVSVMRGDEPMQISVETRAWPQ
jgi:C-terminal processing protease CtpA/Prc